MKDEDDIGTLLRLATRDEPLPTAGAVEIFQRAGSIQRRRRVATGLAGLATLGVLTAGGLAVADHLGSSGDTRIATLPAAPGSAAPTPGAGARSPAAILSTLRALLPAGSHISSPESAKGFARLVLTDRQGRSSVEVNVQPGYQHQADEAAAKGHPGPDLYDCAARAVPAGAHCTATTLPDQTRVVTVEGRAGERGAPAVTMRQVDVLTPADVRVVISVWNAVDVTHGPVTRPTPGLSTTQVETMATSDQWTRARAGAGGGHN
jgi:hypothetical protein